MMHATEREDFILQTMGLTGFVAYRDLEAQLAASPATIRRDLARLERDGRIRRVHGGAQLIEAQANDSANKLALIGTPFDKSIRENLEAKMAIGRVAAKLCRPGEGIMLDGGSTTLQMCDHLKGLGLQVLTNSLHIVNALLPQKDTRVLVPSGTVFREQNIILAAAGEESMPRFYAPKLFLGAAALAPQGLMQADTILVSSQRRLLDRAEQVILLVDHTKFRVHSGAIVCGLDEIDIVITDKQVPQSMAGILADNDVELIIADS